MMVSLLHLALKPSVIDVVRQVEAALRTRLVHRYLEMLPCRRFRAKPDGRQRAIADAFAVNPAGETEVAANKMALGVLRLSRTLP